MRQFELLQQENNEKIANYFMCTQKLVNNMKANDETTFDVQVMEKILQTLTEWFDVITTIEESKDFNMMTINGLQVFEARGYRTQIGL